MEKLNLNLWQTNLWEKLQKKLGRKTWFLKNKKSQLLAIKYPLLCSYNWIDIPRGPIGDNKESQDLIIELINTLKKETHTVFIRIMPANNYKLPTIDHQVKIAHANRHPETTLKLDLSKSEEEILAQMKPKGRYNIRLAQKKGVIIKESKDISSFFKLIQETTQRNQFWGHSQSYYETMLESLEKNAQLLLAEYQGKIIAGGIFIYTQDEAVYYYGASSNQNRNVMAPYLLQWTAILTAKKRGCLKYDFLGIAPENSSKTHPWLGVTSFKKKFGGAVVSYPIAQEIVLKPFIYKAFVFLKKLRSLIH